MTTISFHHIRLNDYRMKQMLERVSKGRVSESDLTKREQQELAFYRELVSDAAKPVPPVRRALMDRKQCADYIAANGPEKYLDLPW